MEPSQLHTELDTWAKANSELFFRHNLTASRLTISKGGQLWKPSNVAHDDSKHPGILFFDYPAVILTRNYAYMTPQKHADHEPQFSLYFFEEDKLPEHKPSNLDEIVDVSPPLLSMFQKLDYSPLQDQRTDVGILKPGDLTYYTAKFKRLSAQANIFEPIIVSLFLWDMDKQQKISAVWRFLPDSSSFKSFEELIPKHVLNESLEMPLPYTTCHKRIQIIVTLDRLFLRTAGASLQKYYEKPNPSNRQAAENDLKQCNQKLTITFAWACMPFPKFSTGDPIDCLFDRFYLTQCASDSYLSNAFAQNLKHEKTIPFELLFEISPQRSKIPPLRHYFNFPICPYTTFMNELIIRPIQAHFKFPRFVKGRNIIAKIHIYYYDKKKIFLDGFYGGSSYTTKCQYHEENPKFDEDIIVSLPLYLPTNTRMLVFFQHASVKSKAKNLVHQIGCLSFPLFNSDGTFIEDGVHRSGILYENELLGDEIIEEVVPPTENNQFIFSTTLRSSIYTSDPQVNHIFNNELSSLENKTNLSQQLVLPHLYSILDKIIENINDGVYEGFNALVKILSLFQRDRSHADSKYLIFYLKFCALRHSGEESFHERFIQIWAKYLKNTEFDQKRSDFFCCWFLLELLTKSLMLKNENVDIDSLNYITSTLSSYLPKFRDSGQYIGNAINKHLCFFYKDLFEFVDHSLVFKMLEQHINLDLQGTTNLFDRECFRDIISTFISPKIFLYLTAPVGNSSLFINLFLPHIKSAMNVPEHTNDIFKLIYDLLLQFEPSEHRKIAPQLLPLLQFIGQSAPILESYPSKSYLVYILVVAHYIFYYNNINKFTNEYSRCASLIIKLSAKLSESEQEIIKETIKKVSTSENITKTMTAGLRESEIFNNPLELEQAPKTRKFASFRMSTRGDSIKLNTNPTLNANYVKIFENLSFAIQAFMLKYGNVHQDLDSLNYIFAKIVDVEIPPLLRHYYYESIKLFAINSTNIIFRNPKSNYKHILRKLFQKLDSEGIELIEELIKIEKKQYHSTNTSISLITRALYKSPPTEETCMLLKNSMFSSFAENLYLINKDLDNEELRVNNIDAYSYLLLKKADLLSRSPDARCEMLLHLTSYHTQNQYYSEAINSQITAAALVAEYLYHLGRLTEKFKDPIQKFSVPCPSCVSEICPDEVINQIPVIRGFCTSKYFNEYGLIYLITNAQDSCKRANLFELSAKLHSLLLPIAESRQLWQLLKKNFYTGCFAWQVIGSFTTTTERNLGTYYRVQYQKGANDVVNYIYRETKFANLWQVCERIKKSAQYYAKGKTVLISNEGEELDPSKFEDDKFYVHVKCVNQFFTPEERKKRITVFEQNHNISKFYFDLPFSKNAQSSIENCWLKRFIFKSPHPLPYIVNRVEIPKENITKYTFSPIEFSCQNLQKQIDLLNEGIARKDALAIQPLLQGSLLVQVNEGPQKIAEVFLGNGEENEHKPKLRNIFRQFLETIAAATKVHGEYVKTNPVFAVLQEELELSLNRLNSVIQTYLK